MSRIAVTGAGGFIGGALVRRLATDGHAVVGIDADPRAAAVMDAAGGGFRRADVTNAAAVFGAVAGVDAVVHAAARVGEVGSMADFIAVNVQETRCGDRTGVLRVLRADARAADPDAAAAGGHGRGGADGGVRALCGSSTLNLPPHGPRARL